MRNLIVWPIVLALVFFGVGEFAGGWYLGVAPQTPVLIYKKTTSRTVSRSTATEASFPFKVDGSLSRGTLTVEGSYELPASFQNPGARPIAAQVFFTETFSAGTPIHVDQTLQNGVGDYTVRLIFTDATGRLRVEVPANNEL